MNDLVEVKTADLSGEALNWAVAIAENLTAIVSPPQYGNPHLVCVMGDYFSRGSRRYSPSTDWSQGGPLIEKHQVCTGWAGDKPLAFTRNAKYSDGVKVAPTLLIAACREIVASVLGETVSVPKELLS